MKNFARAIAVVGLSLSLLTGAASKTAVFQVSFEVKESCSVQSNSGAANAERPAVACQLKAPYQVSRTEATPAAPATSNERGNAIATQTSTQDWTITF